MIDRRTGTSIVAVNLPLTDVRFGALMAERLDLPVFVDNDGNVAALAEHRAGAGVGLDDMLLIGLGNRHRRRASSSAASSTAARSAPAPSSATW